MATKTTTEVPVYVEYKPGFFKVNPAWKKAEKAIAKEAKAKDTVDKKKK